MSSSTECEYGPCTDDPDVLVHSEEWGSPTSRKMCDHHADIARSNDSYEVVDDIGGKWVKTSGTKSASVYHTRKDCRQVVEETNLQPITDDLIEARDLRECSYCAGTVDQDQSSEETTFAQEVRRAQRRGDAPFPVEGDG